jgi:hypothetical protein
MFINQQDKHTHEKKLGRARLQQQHKSIISLQHGQQHSSKYKQQ